MTEEKEQSKEVQQWSRRKTWMVVIGAFAVAMFLSSLVDDDSEKKKEVEETPVQVKSAIEEVKIDEAIQANIEPPDLTTEEIQEVAVEEKENAEPEEKIEPEGEILKVVNVVDGDTIKLDNGEVVRYIGIDTPETVHPSKPVQCFGKEASKKNEELVEGKEIRIVKDVSEVDKYNRLLRYIYVGDIFVNDYLVRNGFANASSYPPDVKYQDQFREAEEEARNNKRGLWADDACKVETESTGVTAISVVKTVVNSTGSAYVCNCKKTCPKMSSCAEAQYQLNSCGCSRRDGDKDGIACDADCQ